MTKVLPLASIPALVLCASAQAAAGTFCVSTGGAGAPDGKSPGPPWRTRERVNAKPLAPAPQGAGPAIGAREAPAAPDSPAGAGAARPLNNLVTELVNRSSLEARPYQEVPFTNPRRGWVFFSSTAAGGGWAIALDGSPREEAVLAHPAAPGGSLEAMRLLPAGAHKLRIWADGGPPLKRLVARAVPELIFCQFQYDPHVPEFGPYDWSFLKKHVLPHVNALVGSPAPHREPMVQEWKRRGGRWIVEVPAKPFFDGFDAGKAFEFWKESGGFKDPRTDGIIVDEFFPGEDPRYGPITESLRRMHREGLLQEKVFYPYCTSMYKAASSGEFVRAAFAAGSAIAWERYLPEPPSEEDAARYLETALSKEMAGWERSFPGCAARMIACLGYLVITESLDIDPLVDWKVWMEMQVRHLATDPAFSGLYGLMEYTSGYADEETVRWAARLYRHYAIEGRTDSLSALYGFKYRLDHLRNPDFDRGLEGWVVSAAEEGSVAAGSMKGYGWLQGRYPRTPKGDTFLLLKRSPRTPNSVAQEIRDLQPGRLYSLKMVTADHGDLMAGRSEKRSHAVLVEVEGVETLRERCFKSVIASNYAHGLGPFDARNPAWLNFHWKLFRAKAAAARLRISDWLEPADPGGPPGREIAANWIEVRPYFDG